MRNKLTRFFLLTVMLQLSGITSTHATELRQNNTWYSLSDSDTVFVFVHGIFSNSKECWTASNGSYWPDILKKDPRFSNPNIFLGGYYTDISSGIYSISDAADELLTNIRTKDVNGNLAPLKKTNIIFVAHSTGGLVVRYLIDKNQELFKDKTLGLVLLASPSSGSAWANRLKWLNILFKNKMAEQLERDNQLVMDLDKRFSDLVGQRKLPGLVGMDAFENKFILPGILWNSEHIVSEADSKSYFGAGRIVPGTDHFSVAKPSSASDYSHVLLWDFYENRFNPIADRVRIKIQTTQPSKTSYFDLTNQQLKDAVFQLVPRMRNYIQEVNTASMTRLLYYQQLMREATTKEEKDRIWNMETNESLLKPSLNFEYSSQFKSDAILLRDEMLKRLPKVQKSSDYLDYEHPTNPIGLNAVIDNLELLAKQLPK